MNDILLASAEEGTYSVGIMALYSVIGMLLVIAVLVILIVLLVVFSKILNSVSVKKAKEPAAETAAPVRGGADEELEVVAAITAAITAYYAGGKTVGAVSEEEDMPVPFVIRSIKKL